MKSKESYQRQQELLKIKSCTNCIRGVNGSCKVYNLMYKVSKEFKNTNGFLPKNIQQVNHEIAKLCEHWTYVIKTQSEPDTFLKTTE